MSEMITVEVAYALPEKQRIGRLSVGNQKNSGFLPEERAWLDELFDDVGYVDALRLVNQEADQYSWWSNRGQARANNVGWRLDYHVVAPQTASKTTAASIYRDESFSDHAPVIIDYAL